MSEEEAKNRINKLAKETSELLIETHKSVLDIVEKAYFVGLDLGIKLMKK